MAAEGDTVMTGPETQSIAFLSSSTHALDNMMAVLPPLRGIQRTLWAIIKWTLLPKPLERPKVHLQESHVTLLLKETNKNEGPLFLNVGSSRRN